jgi:UDP-N-acetylmuramyl pentapeptide synthase
VTPGLISLGTTQGHENYRLGAHIAQAGASLVAIARTNAEALLDGYEAPSRRFDTRADAVAWVRQRVAEHDIVLYLGDLPDYYP